MSRQTTYNQLPDVAFAGVIADVQPREVASKIWEGSTAGKFGIAVTRGTGDDQATLISGATDEVLGFVIATQNVELDRNAIDIAIDENDALNVLRDGSIYVVTEDACTAGGGVYIRYDTGAGGTQLGAVRATAVTDETIDMTAAWQFETSGSAGDVVKIRKK